MAWIAKRPVKVQRDGKMIIIAPGQEVPEAKEFRNPTMWCVWSDKKASAPEKASTDESSNADSGSAEVDYSAMGVMKLRKLAKVAQKKSGDYSTDIKKASNEELILIIKG